MKAVEIANNITADTSIIAHGDGDGTIAAAVLKKEGVNGGVTVTQPFLLHKLPFLAELKKPTIVVDIAVDNREPEKTIEWARKNAHNIVAWIDHHKGGEELAEILGDKFIYNPEAPSCPALMAEVGFDVPAEWLAAANACDAPTKFAPTNLSERYNKAFKVALVALQAGDRSAVAEVQNAFIEELVSGVESELLTAQAAKYEALNAATDAAVANIKPLVGDVGYVDIPEGQASVDVTQVMLRGYKRGFSTVVISTVSAEDKTPLVLIGTNSETDLVKLFGLNGGNTSRIVLYGDKANVGLVRDTFAAALRKDS